MNEILAKKIAIEEIEKELMIAQSDGIIIPSEVFSIISSYKDSLDK